MDEFYIVILEVLLVGDITLETDTFYLICLGVWGLNLDPLGKSSKGLVLLLWLLTTLDFMNYLYIDLTF